MPDDPAVAVLLRVARAAHLNTGVKLNRADTKMLFANADMMTKVIEDEKARYEKVRVDMVADKERRKRKKQTVITIRMVKQIRQARAAGVTFKQIAKDLDISVEAVTRHASDEVAEKRRKRERERHQRLYTDPAYAEALERKRESARAYYRNAL